MTHVRTLLGHSSKVFVVLTAIALMFTWTVNAQADGQAANKLAVAGSDLETTGPNAGSIVVLDETMKVSSVRDLILQLSAECSIVTALTTQNSEENASTTGRVEMWVTIDGKKVPVTQENEAGGEVVFCDRTYSRTVTDQDGDGTIDREDDYIATRTANAFNWVAFDAGTAYDNPTNGNNIINIQVHARYTKTSGTGACTIGNTCSEALIGSRTLVVENTNAQNEEVATTTDPSPAPPPTCPTYPVCP